MLSKLTLEGVSSDESDANDNTKPAVVRRRIWRSEEITMLMRFVARRRRIRASGHTPGSAPHPRDRSSAHQNVSTRPAIAKLPINFYDQAWYDSLSHFERGLLQARAEYPLPIITEDHLR